jgi:DNA-binding NtrC family response regulator
MSGDKPYSLLVVDDEESICLLYQAELEDRGYHVQVQNDGIKVLEDVECLHPDVVILDIKMPGINGLNILKKLKDRFPDVSVILNSAYGSFKNEESVQKADGYVIKSSDLTELIKTIENLLT